MVQIGGKSSKLEKEVNRLPTEWNRFQATEIYRMVGKAYISSSQKKRQRQTEPTGKNKHFKLYKESMLHI